MLSYKTSNVSHFSRDIRGGKHFVLQRRPYKYSKVTEDWIEKERACDRDYTRRVDLCRRRHPQRNVVFLSRQIDPLVLPFFPLLKPSNGVSVRPSPRDFGRGSAKGGPPLETVGKDCDTNGNHDVTLVRV